MSNCQFLKKELGLSDDGVNPPFFPLVLPKSGININHRKSLLPLEVISLYFTDILNSPIGLNDRPGICNL
jgi:hypothetical protein